MSLCADAQALTFVTTQAIGRVHATAAEAVARAPEALLMWTAPDRFVPLRRRAPGVPVFALLGTPHALSVDRRHRSEEEAPNARTPGRHVSTSFGPAVSPGPPALPGAGSARRMHQTTGRPHSQAHLEPYGDPVNFKEAQDAESPTLWRCHRRAARHQLSAPTAEFS